MKRIEKIFGIVIFVLFFYTIICLIINFLDTSFGFLLPNIIIIIFATLLSFVFGMFSPFWNVWEVLKVKTAEEVVKYETIHRAKFLSLSIGYLGVALMLWFNEIFSPMWWMGVALILLCLMYLIFLIFRTGLK